MVDDETIFAVLQHQHEERAGTSLELAVGLVAMALATRAPEGAKLVISLEQIGEFARKYTWTHILNGSDLLITFQPRETADDAGKPTDP